LVEASFLRDLRGFEQHMPEDFVVFGLGFGDSGDDFFWDDKDVYGRSGFDVFKREHEIIFVNKVRGNLSRDDFFEKGHKKIQGRAAALPYLDVGGAATPPLTL
jgi:hypothetical protein